MLFDSIDRFCYFEDVAYHQRNQTINPAECPVKRALYAPLLRADIVLLEENVSTIATKNVDKLHAFIFGDGGLAAHAQ